MAEPKSTCGVFRAGRTKKRKEKKLWGNKSSDFDFTISEENANYIMFWNGGTKTAIQCCYVWRVSVRRD